MADDKIVDAAAEEPSGETAVPPKSAAWFWALVIAALVVAVAWLGWQHTVLKGQVDAANAALAQAEEALANVQSSVDGLEADREALSEALLGMVEEHILVAEARLEAGNMEGAQAGLARAKSLVAAASQLTGDEAAGSWAAASDAIADLENKLAPEATPDEAPGDSASADEPSDEAGSDDDASSDVDEEPGGLDEATE